MLKTIISIVLLPFVLLLGTACSSSNDTTAQEEGDSTTIDPPQTGQDGVAAFNSDTIFFTGQLDILSEDSGSGIYTGAQLGSIFIGSIDYATGFGKLSDELTITDFTCCLAAGGLDISDNERLDAESAEFLNQLAPPVLFSEGDVVDTVNIEGDARTSSGGRIEVGISYILAEGAFDDVQEVNYPIDQYEVLLKLFFILEQGPGNDNDIYDAVGLITSPSIVTLPIPTASVGSLYSYDVDASDQTAGDTQRFSLDTAPDGMSIDGNGLIQWTPSALQIGDSAVVIRVTDGSGGIDLQSYTVTVMAAMSSI